MNLVPQRGRSHMCLDHRVLDQIPSEPVITDDPVRRAVQRPRPHLQRRTPRRVLSGSRDRLLRVSEVADQFGFSTATVYKLDNPTS